MSRLDTLPLAVIKQYVFPCLDYEGRINLNMASLSKDEYIRTRLNMEEVHKMHLKIIASKLSFHVKKVFILDSPKEKYIHHLSIIDILMKYTSILQYLKTLRTTIINKYTSFADIEYDEYQYLDEKYRIVLESKALLEHIKSFPFIRPVSIKSMNDSWSPIHRAYIPERPDLMTNA
jgi:hypothetical protein